jgi:hypothetical protein
MLECRISNVFPLSSNYLSPSATTNFSSKAEGCCAAIVASPRTSAAESKAMYMVVVLVAMVVFLADRIVQQGANGEFTG